jgi:hypothetical protein
MKKLIAIFALLYTSLALSATTVPVQLINPTGSTAGQAIVSTGASSAPAWGAPSVTVVTGTLPVANGGTGATTAANARTNLGAAATSGNLSQFASTTSAQLAGVISDETGTNALVFSTNPTIVTPLITGVSNGSNAASGVVGEYPNNSTTGTSLTTSTAANATSVSLTAGDWDVQCTAQFNPAASTVTSRVQTAVSTTSANISVSLGAKSLSQGSLGTGLAQIVASPTVRVSLASTTTVFCVVESAFTTSTMTVDGFIRARRVR